MSENLKQKIFSTLSPADYRRYFEAELPGQEISKANTGGWVKTLCPFHADTKTPSLQINFLREGAFKCFGCSKTGDLFTWHMERHGVVFADAVKQVAAFFGISQDESKPKGKGQGKASRKKPLGELECVYQYKDLSGRVIYETCRFQNPKDFRQRQPDPARSGEYLWHLNGIAEIIPYNLQAVSRTDTVYIVEGEKDVETLARHSLVASCNPMGAGKWWDSMTPYFNGKAVIILPDNDDPGRTHGALVASKLKPVAKSILIVTLPDLPPGGDVSDWLTGGSGRTKDDFLQVVEKQSKRYEDHIDFLNSKHACIMVSGKFYILNEEWDAVFHRQAMTLSSASDFKLRYLNRRIPNPLAGQKGQARDVSIVSDWLKSPDRRQYSQFIFSPGESMNGCYNYWRGFATTPASGDWSLMKNHILENICSGVQQHFDWLMAWLARIIQDPGGDRPGTAVVLRGDQGVGKGVFLTHFGAILGSHYLQINNQQHLTSRFNNHLKDIVFLFVDEGFWAGDKSAEGLLKGLITEKFFMLEAKGRDAIALKNYINLAMASNSEWVIPAGLDERRFFCLDVKAGKQKQNRAYFDPLINQMNSGGREAWMYDLQHMDISGVDLRRAPRTDALFHQIVHSMSPVAKFWLEILRGGVLNKDDPAWTGEATKESLHDQYVEFCQTIGVRNRKTPVQFGIELKRLLPKESNARYRVVVGGPDVNGKYIRRWGYKLPDWTTCQECFMKIMQMGIDFDNDEGFEVN